MRRLPFVIVLLLAVAACTPDRVAQPAATKTSAAPAASKTSAAPAASAAPAPCHSMAGTVDEAQGTGREATLWALFFNPLRPNTEIKVVWRMTGAGDLSMRATGPGGASVTPVWGPEPHLDSTWHKPGDEWGTGWVFPAAGCWTVHATRTESGAGELSFWVR
ncbi:MAG: hypothetical protein IRZ05_12525 [Micromonosporaceae bacterium]|jgi:hypothetical protein|nr:hypothetical protein [Micromonosporaceae bacterium]